MKRAWQLAAVVLAAGLLGACGADEPAGGGAPTPTPTPTLTPTPADTGTTEPTPIEPTEEPTAMDTGGPQQTITGTLGGDAALEGGCTWLDAKDGVRYEVLWPEGHRVEWNPLRLVGPGGEVVAEDGDELDVAGHVDDDVMSICMVGTIFSATDVTRGAVD